MRINQHLHSQLDTKQLQTNIEGGQSFDQMIQSQSIKLKQEEMKHLMREISIQGDRLNRFRSVRELVKFKRLIKGFLEETVFNGLELQHAHSFSLHGDNRKLSIVKEIDVKLIELTEEIMNQEEKAVDLLGVIGEIKGLLVNLYT